MRPKSIVLFERLYLASALLGFLTTLFSYESLRAYSVARGGAAAISLLAAILSLGASLLFWFLIVRRAQTWAKWVITVFAAIGLVSIFPEVLSGAYAGLPPSYIVLSGVSSLLNLAAITFLFRQDARWWFAGRGQMPIDSTVFE